MYNYMNYSANYLHTHPILQIWPLTTFGCLQTSKQCSNEEVISETEAYFEVKDKSFYKKDIELLEKCWNLRITLERDCLWIKTNFA